MSGAAARITTAVTEVEPTDAVGNKRSGDSASLRASHSSQERDMTAVEGKSDGVAMLVVEWQSAPSGLAQRQLANMIMRLLQPTIRRVAFRFGASARGSLSQEDLEQVAAIEAFKFFSKYDHAKANGTPVEQHVYRRALRACAQQVMLHASDVRPSLHAQRGTQGKKNPTRWFKGLTEKPKAQVENGDDSEPEAHTDTPEQLLSNAQTLSELRAALSSLPADRRELILDAFGIGRDQEASLRDIAARRDVPRSRLAKELEEALTELRESLEP